jgi:hypothetical protein
MFPPPTVAPATFSGCRLSIRTNIFDVVGRIGSSRVPSGVVVVADSILKLRLAVEHFQAAVVQRDSEAISSRLGSLVGVAAKYRSVAKKYESTPDGIDGTAQTWITCMLKNGEQHKDLCIAEVQRHDKEILDALLESLTQKSTDLAQYIGGVPESTDTWHDGLSASCTMKQILERAKHSVCKLQGKAISTARSKVEKVLRTCIACQPCPGGVKSRD